MMGEKEHTEEPWRRSGPHSWIRTVLGSDGQVVAYFPKKADMCRAIECINACAGIEYPGQAVPRLVRVSRSLFKELAAANRADPHTTATGAVSSNTLMRLCEALDQCRGVKDHY